MLNMMAVYVELNWCVLSFFIWTGTVSSTKLLSDWYKNVHWTYLFRAGKIYVSFLLTGR